MNENTSQKPLVVTLVACACALALALVTLCCLSGCSSDDTASESDTKSITDMRGRTVDVPTDPERIVAIGCALRPVCYLQAEDLVVGVEESETEDSVSCAYRHVNHDLFADLPVIGDGGSSGVTVNEEALMEADPQIVICDSLSADEADNLQDKTGITFVCLDQPETVFDDKYYENLELLGEVLNKEDRATEVVDYIKGIQTDLSDRSSSSENAGDVTAYAAGISYRGGHGFDGTEANFQPFVACDITNIADGHGSDGPFTIDLETVSSAQPDYIFVESSNLSLVKESYDSNPAYFSALNAVENGNTYSLISYRFYSTNVELALANCYQVGATVYPDTFSDVDPTEKLDEISEFFLGAPLSEDLAAEGYTFEKLDIASL